MSAPATAKPIGAAHDPIPVKCTGCFWSGEVPDLLKDDTGPLMWCPQCRRATWVWASKPARQKARNIDSEFRRGALLATQEIAGVERRLRIIGANVETHLDVDYGAFDAYCIQWRYVTEDVSRPMWRLTYWSDRDKGKPLMECSAAIRVQCAPRLKELEEKAIEAVRTVRQALR